MAKRAAYQLMSGDSLKRIERHSAVRTARMKALVDEINERWALDEDMSFQSAFDRIEDAIRDFEQAIREQVEYMDEEID